MLAHERRTTMKKTCLIPFAAITAIMLLVVSTWRSLDAKALDPADTIYTNGKIYTVNDKQPWAEAVAIKDGKFIAVGKNADVQKLKGNKTEVIDLGGKFVMPGIVDSHLHLSNVYGLEESGELLFPESLTPKEIQEKVKEHIAANPDRKSVRANKYGLGHFPDGRATKEFVDEISTEIPIMIFDETGHNAVANTKALALAGITRDTKDPFGGSIHRNADGEPSGYLSETAIGLVGKHFPRVSAEARYKGLLKAMPAIHPYGITSFRDPMCAEEVIEAYQRLEKKGKLKFRIDLSVLYDDFAVERRQVYTLDKNRIVKSVDLTPTMFDCTLE
jgi:predicted amidohydrolase YtcJ